jgi:hypothetical protein
MALLGLTGQLGQPTTARTALPQQAAERIAHRLPREDARPDLIHGRRGVRTSGERIRTAAEHSVAAASVRTRGAHDPNSPVSSGGRLLP